MMRKLLLILAIAVSSLTASQARTKNALTVNGGGLGPYKAVVVEDFDLPGFTIIRPKDLRAAAAAEGKLPVIVFGNGACARDSRMFYEFLTEICSYGYIAVTNGVWSAESSEQRRWAQAPAPPSEVKQAPAAAVPATLPDNAAEIREVLATMSWFDSQVADKESDYYDAVDTRKLIAMGQSCGGLQALYLSIQGDSRIKTTVAISSGTFDSGAMTKMVSRDDILKLQVPVLYMIGGPDDIAYPNGKADFGNANVPAAFVNIPGGHVGTFLKPRAGEFTLMAELWLKAIIKDDPEAIKAFKECKLPESVGEGWTIESKNF